MLARPELQRFAEVATYFENAALKSTDALQAKQVLDRQVASHLHVALCWKL